MGQVNHMPQKTFDILFRIRTELVSYVMEPLEPEFWRKRIIQMLKSFDTERGDPFYLSTNVKGPLYPWS